MTDQPATTQSEESAKPAAKLSDELEEVLKKLKDAPMTIGAMQQLLKGRGFMLLLVVLVAPFAILPFAPPGLNFPVAIATIVIGMRIALGLAPWLPKRVLDRKIGSFMQKLLEKLVPIMRRLEKWFQERWTFLLWPGFSNVIGVAMAWCAVMLMMPPPMLNSPPAVGIILFCIGFMLRDGILLVLGYLVTVGTTVGMVLATAKMIQWAVALFGWVASFWN
jgi:hypothetical protein